MKKILQVVGKMHRAGMETLLMNVYRNIDKTEIQFDFCVHDDEKGDYDDEILLYGGKIYHMPKAEASNLFRIQKYVDELFEKNSEYVAVHVHYSCVGFYYFRAAKKYGVKNLIYHAHNSSREGSLRSHIRYCMEQYSVSMANIYLACSDLAGEYNFHGKQYFLLNNGVDTAKFRFSIIDRVDIRRKMNLQNKKVCIHVGRFDIQKNHKFLIKVFEQLYYKDNMFVLLLFGSGPLINVIKEQISTLKCKDNIFFMGNVNDVYRYMSAADVFLLPSLYEGLPLTLVEAQASGLKCFVSDTITETSKLVAENIEFISINNTDEWVNRIVSNFDYVRGDKSDIVKEKGFDCKECANVLVNFYKSI